MINNPGAMASDPIRERLPKAAFVNFMFDDDRKVAIRLVAENAGANVSTIHYCFGDKEGLYEAIIRKTLNLPPKVLDGSTHEGRLSWAIGNIQWPTYLPPAWCRIKQDNGDQT